MHAFVLTTVHGGNALSPFRAAALVRRLQAAVPAVTEVSGRYVHQVASDAALGAATSETVTRLLTYGPPAGPVATGASTATVVVAPRLGTLSPWASKATDIAHSCGVAVRRVERVVEYTLASDAPLSDADWATCADLLHDRMTESAFASIAEAARLFDEREAEPMAHVDVIGRGRTAIEEANVAFGLALSDDEIDYLVTLVHRPRAEPHRRRAHDVRAGQLRALPPQDLQRRLHRRRRAAGEVAVRDDPPHRGRQRAGHGRRVQGQRLGDGRRPDHPLGAGGYGRAERVRGHARRGPRPHEGRDPQPPDRDQPVPRRGDRAPAARSATRARRAAAPPRRRASPASPCRTSTCPARTSRGSATRTARPTTSPARSTS